MEERKEVLIVCLILLAIGAAFFCITIFYSGFNFYRAELNTNENFIEETLYFKADKPYHTLYRNFETPIVAEYSQDYKRYSQDGYISINSVSCKEGQAYAIAGSCYIFPGKITRSYCPYTEPNEYGCTFGYNYGFAKGEEYWIKSSYTLKPNTIFKINGKYYIKFVAYSENNHKFLIKGKSLILNKDAIAKSYYLPNEDVIVYVPYKLAERSSFAIIERNDFDFGSSRVWLSILFFLSPTIIFFLLWHFLGKENLISELPPEMSFYPRERKGWEVAAFFNPPFSKIDRNFFSAIMLDFYRRKIIDIKMRDEKVYVKINQENKNLDETEKKFLSILKTAYKNCNEKHKEGEYFNLKKAASSFIAKSELRTKAAELQKKVKKESKNYLETQGGIFLIPMIILFTILYPIASFLYSPTIFIFFFISLLVIVVINFSSSILIKFKGEYYKEYEHWQAYRKFLKYSSLKLHSHRGVVLWERHLVYASALGVAKRVLKELKKEHLISEQQYALYIGNYHMSTSFARSSGAGAHGGGGFGGGVGGGGMGGGGGGGR